MGLPLRLPLRYPMLGEVANYYHHIYESWNSLQAVFSGQGMFARQPRGHGYNMNVCNAGAGPATDSQAWPNCGASYVIHPPFGVSPFASQFWVWGKYVSGVNVHSQGSYYQPGTKYTWDGVTDPPRFRMNPVTNLPTVVPPGTAPSPQSPTVRIAPMPRRLVPHIRNHTGRQVGNGSGGPMWDPPIPEGPRPSVPGTDPHVPEPPRPGTREKKGRMPVGLMRALGVAYQATEAADLADALFDALPKDIRKQVPKSGRARKGSRIGEGTPYATPWDKARHVWENLEHLDLSQAVINILKNHILDMIIGGAHGRTDEFSRRFVGGSRFAGGF